MFMMINQNEVAKLNILNIPAPIDGDTREMNRYTKAFADKVAPGSPRWSWRALHPRKKPQSSLLAWNPAGRRTRPRRQPRGEDSETAEDSDTMSLRDDEEPEDMDVLAQQDEW